MDKNRSITIYFAMIKSRWRIPGANKAVKSREDGVTRYVAGYTVFFFMQSAVLEAVMRFASVPSFFGSPARQEGSPAPPL